MSSSLLISSERKHDEQITAFGKAAKKFIAVGRQTRAVAVRVVLRNS